MAKRISVVCGARSPKAYLRKASVAFAALSLAAVVGISALAPSAYALESDSGQAAANQMQTMSCLTTSSTSQTQNSSAGFFEWLGDSAACNILTGAPMASYTKIGATGDATTLDNLEMALDGIDRCNELRASEGRAALKVTSQLMAISEVQSNASAYTMSHTGQYNVGENLAWGFATVNSAFAIWYDWEKAGNGGHYQNIVNSSYALTGYSANQYGSYRFTQGQVFIWSTTSYGTSYTVAEYRAKLEQYEAYLASKTPTGAFATRLYTEVLDRQPDTSGYLTQVKALNSGTAPAEIAYNYFNSKEYFMKGETAEQTVERVYQVMFGRASDSKGKAMWVSYLEGGRSIRSVVQGFSEAAEYKAYFSKAGLNNQTIDVFSSSADAAWDKAGSKTYAGGNYRDLNAGTTGFAARMYTKCLGRSYDVGGLNNWSRALQGGMTCYQVAKEFFFSTEFKGHNYADADFVDIAYRAILGREADDAGRDHWVELLDGGMSRETLVHEFCKSDEFGKICKQYGMVSGA